MEWVRGISDGMVWLNDIVVCDLEGMADEGRVYSMGAVGYLK